MTFRGRLLGKPIPRAGVPVTLQAAAGGRWITFSNLRTNGKGRFRDTYTFRSTTGLQRYRFRARVARDPRYPYESGRSNLVVVVVRG